MKIALAGNPNSGKTTLFNALTGSNQYVGNWPGVTVEKKEGKYRNDKSVEIIDLPGIYSLSPYTLEEVVARNYIVDERPDGILNIVDGSNLERNLYLTTQLIDLGLPMVVAVNMSDVVKKRGDVIDLDKLAEKLGVKVFSMSAVSKQNIYDAIDALCIEVKNVSLPKVSKYMSEDVEKALSSLSSSLKEAAFSRFLSVKYLENDTKMMDKLHIDASTKEEADSLRKELEDKRDDDIESIITSERYEFIEKVIAKTYKRKSDIKETVSDKIDKIVTNRILALPIFVLVMIGVYYISVTTVGTAATDWVNDVLFTEIIPPAVENFLVSINCAAWLQSLILDGIVAGLGAILGFVPQILVLFFLLAILEECGYMARIAFILDRIFRKFGLSGKSFIPMLIGTGCGVPGVMASRTIENERDRRMTIMTTTFIPCSAKLPIIAMISGALFNEAWWVAPSAYFLGVGAIIVSGIILKKTKPFLGEVSPFVMELPEYHVPTLGAILRSMWERGWSFIKKAGTIIFLSTILVWFTTNFGFVDGKFRMLEPLEISYSIAAVIGGAIAFIFTPLGWGNWQAAVATIMGLVAKENLVVTYGIIYGIEEASEEGAEFWGTLATSFTPIAAYSLLAFNLLCAPCFAAIGAIKREMNNTKWTLAAVGYECLFAYVVAMIIFQIGSLIIYGTFSVFTLVAFALLGVMIYLLFRKPKYTDSLGE